MSQNFWDKSSEVSIEVWGMLCEALNFRSAKSTLRSTSDAARNTASAKTKAELWAASVSVGYSSLTASGKARVNGHGRRLKKKPGDLSESALELLLWLRKNRKLQCGKRPFTSGSPNGSTMAFGTTLTNHCTSHQHNARPRTNLNFDLKFESGMTSGIWNCCHIVRLYLFMCARLRVGVKSGNSEGSIGIPSGHPTMSSFGGTAGLDTSGRAAGGAGSGA
jgi:hypothetical protein